MKPRKKKLGLLYRVFFDSVEIEGGQYRAKFNLIKLIVTAAVITGMLVTLEVAGALDTIGKMVGYIFR